MTVALEIDFISTFFEMCTDSTFADPCLHIDHRLNDPFLGCASSYHGTCRENDDSQCNGTP